MPSTPLVKPTVQHLPWPPLRYVYVRIVMMYANMRVTKYARRAPEALADGRVSYAALALKQLINTAVDGHLAVATDGYTLEDTCDASWNIGHLARTPKIFGTLARVYGTDSKFFRQAWRLRTLPLDSADRVARYLPRYVRFGTQMVRRYAVGLPNLHDPSQSPKELERFYHEWTDLELELRRSEGWASGCATCAMDLELVQADAWLPQRCPDVLLRRNTDQALLMRHQDVFSINEGGLAIWSALDGRTSPAQVVQALEKQYRVSAVEAARQCHGCLRVLKDWKLIH